MRAPVVQPVHRPESPELLVSKVLPKANSKSPQSKTRNHQSHSPYAYSYLNNYSQAP